MPVERAAASPTSSSDTDRPRSKLRWVLGWVLAPGSLLFALFLAGVHVGGRHPDMALSRALLWLFG